MRKASKVLLSTGMFLAGILLLSCSVFAQQFKSFENKQLKYTVKYPADYQVKPLGRLIVFISPVADKKTGFSENVNIAVQTLSAPIIKLDDFFKLAKDNLTISGSGVKILEEKKEKLSGTDAYRIVYSSKQKKTNFKLLQVVAIYKDKAYVVTYTALAEQFDSGLSQANSIIKSLKFTN
jgi:hypothetical protein